jgi:Predicted membrane-associated Zn-dependent proteases 1
VKAGYPAQEAGLVTGDRILAVDGQAVTWWDDLSSLLHSKINNVPVVLSVQREGKDLEIPVIPKVETTDTLLGDTIKVGLIGISPGEETRILRFGVIGSCAMGAQRIGMLTQVTYLALYRMIIGKMSVRESIAGPVVIFKITGKPRKSGLSPYCRSWPA